jgi:MFS family permease
LGALLGLLMTPPLMALGGWRVPFWVLGAAGLAWVALWLPATANAPSPNHKVHGRS